MLSFDIRSLEDQAATVNGELSATDPIWIEGDMRPESAVRATGRLSVAGPGRYYWSGAIAGTATVPCRRCLTDTTVKVAENVHVLYAEAGDEIDDPEVYELAPRARDDRSQPRRAGAVAARGSALPGVPGRLQGALPDVWCRAQCGRLQLPARCRCALGRAAHGPRYGQLISHTAFHALNLFLTD